jgi:hypothetical protein
VSRTGSPTRHRSSQFTRSSFAEAPPALQSEVTRATQGLVGKSLVSIDPGDVEGTLRELPAVAGASVDRAFPNTLVVKIAPERPGGRSSVAARPRGLRPAPARSSARSPSAPSAACRVSGYGVEAAIRLGGEIPAALVPATRALAAAHEAGLGGRVKGVRHLR